MKTAKQVDEELSKLWTRRGFTRGIPDWERRIAKAAIEELEAAGEPSKLRRVNTRYGSPEKILGLGPEPKTPVNVSPMDVTYVREEPEDEIERTLAESRTSLIRRPIRTKMTVDLSTPHLESGDRIRIEGIPAIGTYIAGGMAVFYFTR